MNGFHFVFIHPYKGLEVKLWAPYLYNWLFGPALFPRFGTHVDGEVRKFGISRGGWFFQDFWQAGFRRVWPSPGHQKGEQWKKDLGCLGPKGM